MLKYTSYFVCALCSVILLGACSKSNSDRDGSKNGTSEKLPRFIGDYNRELDDRVDKHMSGAKAKGINALALRADTLKYIKDGSLVRLPNQLELFRVDDLKYSIPYLVPDAAKLLVDVSMDFRDSLISEKLPLYRLVVTSVTRTNEDLEKLMKRNLNAIPESAHRYATTFDISWKRFDRGVSTDTSTAASPDRLKFVLGQVLFNLKNKNMCYVKHERKQACYHITVR
ncbi:MAG: hypothetical protein H6Q14_2043 [Bacteroidetes bacterium]|nr:hypothetical protein [Bacteroidota bacterium]